MPFYFSHAFISLDFIIHIYVAILFFQKTVYLRSKTENSTLLDYKLFEGNHSVDSVHNYIPSTQHSTRHTTGAQEIAFERIDRAHKH